MSWHLHWCILLLILCLQNLNYCSCEILRKGKKNIGISKNEKLSWQAVKKYTVPGNLPNLNIQSKCDVTLTFQLPAEFHQCRKPKSTFTAYGQPKRIKRNFGNKVLPQRHYKYIKVKICSELMNNKLMRLK